MRQIVGIIGAALFCLLFPAMAVGGGVALRRILKTGVSRRGYLGRIVEYSRTENPGEYWFGVFICGMMIVCGVGVTLMMVFVGLGALAASGSD